MSVYRADEDKWPTSVTHINIELGDCLVSRFDHEIYFKTADATKIQAGDCWVVSKVPSSNLQLYSIYELTHMSGQKTTLYYQYICAYFESM